MHERIVYFCGRYYDLGPQLALRAVLRSGDTFVDIGANIGLMTLLAAHAVGPTGVVYAFEPNPDCCERLQLHVARNRLTHVYVHPVGLSEQDAMLSLTRDTGSSVHGSLAPPTDEAAVTARYTVPVRRGDDLLTHAPSKRPMVIKIDVEGFECRTLRGLAATIERHAPVVLTEVVAGHLARAGSTVAELFDLMSGFGYTGSAMTIVRRWTRYRLHLVPVITPETMPQAATDVLWTPSKRP
jgi:FkbM family methyltransferase